MAPGARRNFGAPVFEFEVFRKQMYGIEENTCDIVWTFWRPQQSFCSRRSDSEPRSDSAPGELCQPLATPLRQYKCQLVLLGFEKTEIAAVANEDIVSEFSTKTRRLRV